MSYGYIKVYREIQKSELWFSEPFTKSQAWIDMLLLANHTTKTVWIRGIPIEVKRGQLAYSKTTLAKRWRWSRKKVSRFLSYLCPENAHQITQQNTNVTTIITIVNYDKWQGTTQQTTQQKNRKRPSKRPTNNKCNNNVTKNVKGTAEFEYPKWLDMDLWQKFKQHRQKLRAPMTQEAERRNILKLKTLMGKNGKRPTQDDIIGQSIQEGWKGLFEFKGKSKTQTDSVYYPDAEDVLRKKGML